MYTITSKQDLLKRINSQEYLLAAIAAIFKQIGISKEMILI